MEAQTIDQLIAVMEQLKEKHGGDCRVRLRLYGNELLVPSIYERATGKSAEWRLVSRGGVPCIVISE